MKDLTTFLTESKKDLPRANVLCPATNMMGEAHIIIGEPFTTKDKATHKKALKLAMSLDSKASQFANLDDFADIYRDEYGFDLEPSDELVFVFAPSTKEVYTTLINELTIL